MEMKEWKSEIIPIADLVQHPRNPRVHPESLIVKLVKSIEHFGWTNPVILAKDGTVLAGHARLTAAARMGIDRVPVIKTDLDGDKAEAYLIADNKIADESEWDTSRLKEIILDLDHGGFDLELTGFSLGEVEEMMTAAGRFNFDALDKESEELAGADDEVIRIIVPKAFSEEVKTYLANGEMPTAPGLGRGILKRCGLL